MPRRPAKRGRVTPKKTTPTDVVGPAPHSGRYTPPIPKEFKQSPRWVPVLMFTLLILGMLVIVGNYLLGATELSVQPSNWYLFLGLGLITAGFITATKYH
jgi:hypothetical protein